MKSREFELFINHIINDYRSHIVEQFIDYEALTIDQNIRLLTEVGHMLETEKKRLIKG